MRAASSSMQPRQPELPGAYRLRSPGAATTMNVTMRLYFRKDVVELGIAPLTSMYLFSNIMAKSSRITGRKYTTATAVHEVRRRANLAATQQSDNAGTAISTTLTPAAFGLLQREGGFQPIRCDRRL